MVAQNTTIADRFTEAPATVLSGRSRVVKLKRSDLPLLVQMGIVPEDASTELLWRFESGTTRCSPWL